jgi:hypothetical protein
MPPLGSLLRARSAVAIYIEKTGVESLFIYLCNRFKPAEKSVKPALWYDIIRPNSEISKYGIHRTGTVKGQREPI